MVGVVDSFVSALDAALRVDTPGLVAAQLQRAEAAEAALRAAQDTIAVQQEAAQVIT
jgi:hypothetical protein